METKIIAECTVIAFTLARSMFGSN